MTDGLDRWHRWLLDGRYGGDAAYRERTLIETLYPVRDKVLDKARLQPGETLLDVGAGDGLIAFGALQRLGPAGRVIFAEISRDLLDHSEARVIRSWLAWTVRHQRHAASARAEALAVRFVRR